MRKPQKAIQLTSYNELLGIDESVNPGTNQIVEVPLSELYPFKNHPFQVRDDEKMEETVESIRNYGVLNPGLVRPRAEGGYEVVAGHRRKRGCELAGKTTMPVLVRDYTDDEAVVIMVDSNIQRENILPSEKAYAYKLKMEALSHQGIACGQVGHKSRDDISDTDSGRQVQRYIRLTYLIPELLEKMDKEEIAFSVGVELSYLDEYSQRDVLEQCEINDCTPSYSQAWRMHKADREGLLAKDVIQFLMSEEKPNQRETVKIPTEKLREFAPDANPRQLEDFVLKACEHYRKYLIRQRGREER